MLASIVIRTLNEAKYLGELLQSIAVQETPDDWGVEVVVVDSGSTDSTLSIARKYKCKVVHIRKRDFTFGRSLNLGCDTARGDVLVMISGHCVPKDRSWLQSLVAPIVSGDVGYTYGRQVGRDTTKFSERRVFRKYFPDHSMIPQEGYFTNNANAAVSRSVYEEFKFDEILTGLEDMHLAKKLVDSGGAVGYVATAEVYHIHDESWAQVRRRYEREAIALESIMPEARISFKDFISCYFRSIAKDSYWAIRERVFLRNIVSIVLFRFNQFFGSYTGTKLAADLARVRSKNYFYPDRQYVKPKEDDEKSDRVNAY